MKILGNIRKHFSPSRKTEEKKVQPLRVEGVDPAPITPEPDNAELATQALLESLIPDKEGKHGKEAEQQPSGEHDAAYYQHVAEKMRKAKDIQRQRTMRFLAFCEAQLAKPDLPMHGSGSLELIETELYKRIDIVEHEGGELKRRWQHCLATVTVKIMEKVNLKV